MLDYQQQLINQTSGVNLISGNDVKVKLIQTNLKFNLNMIMKK